MITCYRAALKTSVSKLRLGLAAGYKKTLKQSKPEEYLQVMGSDGKVVDPSEKKTIEEIYEVKVMNAKSPKLLRGFNPTDEEEKPIPCCASLGPIVVQNPEIFSKKYKWCSCGMSRKQVIFAEYSPSAIKAIVVLCSSQCESTFKIQ